MSSVLKIQKRNKVVADFDPLKIKNAITRACQAVNKDVATLNIDELVTDILELLDDEYAQAIPTVEDVQNCVEEVLMESGHFDVARAYIIYRYEHAKAREERKEEVQKKIEEDELYIIKRTGQRQKFSMDKLKEGIRLAAGDLSNEIDIHLIAQQCRAELYDDIKTHDIERTLILTTRAMIERDPAYSKVAARLLMHKISKEVFKDRLNFGDFDKQYREAFIANIKELVSIERLDKKMLSYDLNLISSRLILNRDDEFDYLGLQVLYDRYFLRNPETGEVLETPQMFWMRVAMGIALAETTNREGRVMEFYEMMSTLRYVPSTPTLFHAGTCHPQLSSCYLTTVQDSLDHIFKSYADNAQLSKWSGGIGNDWTNIRATNSMIKGTGVESQGVIPFLKIANDTTVAINRSGRRRGATCAYLETWHYDIEDFLELRKNTGDERRRTHDMNTANWIPDLFMKRVRDNGDWLLLSPDEAPDLHHIYGKQFEERYAYYEEQARQGKLHVFKFVKAKDLWRKMISMLFETGHPWITWKDPANVRSPQDHAGVIHSTNLCTEIMLNTSEDETAVCNLGSVNLSRHIIDGKFDQDKIRETVHVAIRMLDNVIDVNFYPTKEGKNANMRHRPIGLGVMGFQDALYKLNIAFESDDAVRFADESMEVISYNAIMASSLLAKERGAYESYSGSKWDRGIFPVNTLDVLEDQRGEQIPVSRNSKLDWGPVRDTVAENGMRNSNCMAVAPTATIANISGCFPTIEPIYKNMYVKSNMSGEFAVVNKYLVEELKKRNLWTDHMRDLIKNNDGSITSIEEIPQDVRDMYKEVFDINTKHLVNIVAHRGKWIDQSQSFNIFYQGNSGKDIGDIYLYAWTMGLKSTYYLRTMGASHVEKSTVKLEKKASDNPTSATVVKPVQQSQPSPTISSVQPAVQPQPVASAPAPVVTSSSVSTPIISSKPAQNLCKILDPSCEACE